MALHKTRAVVIGRRAFGESDRLVDFYTREYGKVRGIARGSIAAWPAAGPPRFPTRPSM